MNRFPPNLNLSAPPSAGSFSRASAEFYSSLYSFWEIHSPVQNKGFPGGTVVKNPPANAGDTGSIPGSGRSLGEGNATHSSILAWRIPWAEEPGGLQSIGS